ncbi:MAG TPA: aminoacyl-tRNA hydrolase [Myxococcales bacterium]|nr:aminoacyl-tRNA hydrolase [Myxococcales bacterium]
MKLIVGLGNPGRRYGAPRHNVGFRIVDALASEARIGFSVNKFDAAYGQGTLEGQKIALLKPQTFMNLSGSSVAPAAQFYKVEPEDLIVVHDELDLPFGRLQLKRGGGTGGHRGLNSIVERLGSSDFIRVRVGIGKPDSKERVVGHVLSGFGKDEASALEEVAKRAVDAVRTLLREGAPKAMTEFNKK